MHHSFKTLLSSFVNKAVNPNRLFENRKYLHAFQFIAFGFVLINLVELAVTASLKNQWATELTFPSRFFAIIGMLGLLVFLEAFNRFVCNRMNPIVQHTLYVLPTISAFLFYYQEIVSLSYQKNPIANTMEAFYEIILYKPIFISFCPIPLLQLFLVIGDTVLIMLQWQSIQNTRAISLCILNVLIPFVIPWLPGKIQIYHTRFKSDSPHETMNEAFDWIEELLNGLPDGVIVFKEDGAVKYYNDSIISMLGSKEENFLAELIKLPNKDLLSEMLAEDGPLLPVLAQNHRSDPIKRRISAFKDEFREKKDETLTFSPSIRGRSNKSSRKKDGMPVSLHDFDHVSLVHLTSHNEPKRPVDKTFRKNNTLQGSDIPSPNAQRKSLLFRQDSEKVGWDKNLLDNPKEFLKRKLTIGENLPNSLSPEAPQKFSKIQQNLSILFENSMLHISDIGKEEFFDQERIAQDQAMKISPKTEAVKRQILSGEKKSKHSTVGDAILSILRQINQKEEKSKLVVPGSIPPLQPSRSYSHGQRISVTKQILRRNYRNATLAQFINLQNEKEDASEDPFTGELCMDSFLKIGTDQIRYFTIIFSSVKVKNQTYLLVTMKDTTNQDIASRLRELDKKKNQTLAMVSHEYRSPLNGIVSMLEILSDKINPEYDQKYIKPALGSAKRLLGLVNDILDFHQLENQKLRLNYEPCVLKDVVKSAMSIIELPVKNRGLELSLQIDELIPKTIVTDSNRLQQIILNLLSNALKFTLTGGIYINVHSVEEGRILFEIADTGIGIKEENISKLFKEFGKIDLGTKTSMNKQGVGLGLQISDALAKKLSLEPGSGGLRVKSVYGRGTTFSFTIDDFSRAQEENFFYVDEDFAELDSGQKANRAQEIKVFESTGKSFLSEEHPAMKYLAERALSGIDVSSSKLLKIPTNQGPFKPCLNCAGFLVVDDDEFNLCALTNLLETMGITRVQSARNGKEAINLVNEKAMSSCHNSYSIIFMDCEMPILNGYDTAKKLSEMAMLGLIPHQTIIGITGHVGKDYIEKCLQSGMSEVMTKPLNKKDFTTRIQQLLSNK